jgi:hypothetical protein
MECIHIGSKIITLAIQMHGKVIDLDLSPEKNRIFENVRLFSNAGEFEDVLTSMKVNLDIKSNLSSLFQKDLTQSTLSVISEYISRFKPEYTKLVKQSHSSDLHLAEKSCKIYSNITLDKSFGISGSDEIEGNGIVKRCLNYLNNIIEGVYVVSIHEKKDENNYELLYPDLKTDTKNLNLTNLDDLRIFANIFGREPPNLSQYSTILPDPHLFIDHDKQIENDTTLTLQQKHRIIQELKDEFYGIRNRWKLTIKNDRIESIKMSVLVDLIKNIVREECKINLFDFSCNTISMFTPEIQQSTKRYVIADDIDDLEKGISRHWGGKKSRKKIKKKIKKQQKRKRVTKRYKI